MSALDPKLAAALARRDLDAVVDILCDHFSPPWDADDPADDLEESA